MIKINIHSSCEIEGFVETHLCKLCVILRSRVLRVVCPHQGYRSATPVRTTAVYHSYQDQRGDVSQSVRGNYDTSFGGGQNLTSVEESRSVYQVNPVSRITGEGRAEFLRTCGPGFVQEGAEGRRGNSICARKLQIL